MSRRLLIASLQLFWKWADDRRPATDDQRLIYGYLSTPEC
jgi:hypothetical protein